MDIDTGLWLATLIVALVIIVILVTALTRAHDTNRRLDVLSDAARELAGGKRVRPIPVQGEHTVRNLTDAFNHLAVALPQRVQLAETERGQLAAVLSHMADGVLIADRQGIVQLINPAAVRLLELTPSWAEGRPAQALVGAPELVALVRALLDDDPAGRTPRLLELGPPGQRRAIQAVASRLPGQRRAGPYALVMLQDVTALRDAERARRDLVANASHELRTPVAALKALVETLEEGALEDPEAAPEFLDRMHIEADRLAQLVEELLELAKIESGQVTARTEPTDLGPVVVAAAERLRPQAERQGLELIVGPPAALPLVRADPDRIQQIVVNLVHNAVKFTPPGGRVTVAATADRDEVTVRVSDTGIGIAPETLARLFERFYKADRARAGGGTGLGLAIAKHLVQTHNGRIWAESAGPSQGATFIFSLPIDRLTDDPVAHRDTHHNAAPQDPSNPTAS